MRGFRTISAEVDCAPAARTGRLHPQDTHQ